jgi:hypothetical protein
MPVYPVLGIVAAFNAGVRMQWRIAFLGAPLAQAIGSGFRLCCTVDLVADGRPMSVISEAPLIHAETVLWAPPIGLIFVSLGCSALGKLRVPATVLLVALQLAAEAGTLRRHTDEMVTGHPSYSQRCAGICGRVIRRPLPVAAPLIVGARRPAGAVDEYTPIANGEANWYLATPGMRDDVVLQALLLRPAWLVSRLLPDRHATSPLGWWPPRGRDRSITDRHVVARDRDFVIRAEALM